MINFFKITAEGYQVMLEKHAFYFMNKLPVAFRDCGDPRIFVKDGKHGKSHNAFLECLSAMGRVIRLPGGEFDVMIRRIYNKAILAGSERAALERFGFQDKEKQDVSNRKSDAD